MKNKLAVILTGGILALTTGILPSHAINNGEYSLAEKYSSAAHKSTSLIKSDSKILISQASVDLLQPGRSKKFVADRSSKNFKYSKWQFCFSSANSRNKKARVTIGNKYYPTSGKLCLNFEPTGRSKIIKNTGRTNIEYSWSPIHAR